MWDGYFTLGGNEVANNARALGYTRTSDCPVSWLRDQDCAGLAEALGDSEYLAEQIDSAPWYDPDDPDLTSRFLGLYVVSMEGVSNSTRQGTVTEKNTDGGRVSGYRHASREIRVRAMLSANGEDALEAGMTWLRNVLEPDACGVHGGDCGTSDLQFFVSCPPERGTVEDVGTLMETRRNLWKNPRAVSGGTAFGFTSDGSASYITDFPGTVTTARRWVSSSSSGNSSILSMTLGTSTPDQGDKVHVMMTVRITGGNLNNAAIRVRPLDGLNATGQTEFALGTLTPGTYNFDVNGITTATVAVANGGVFLMGGASATGVTVDVTQCLVAIEDSGDYFDGDSVDAGTEQYSWTGTTNASESIAEEASATIRPQTDEEYQAVLDQYIRVLHAVTCVSGPLVQRKYKSNTGSHYGYLVEFTLLAATPYVYGVTKHVDIPPTPPTVMQDIPFNLVPYPSAELASGSVVVQTNYSTNPSAETDATGWAAYTDGTAITAGMVTSGRITGELAAVGAASYRVVFTATGAGSNGQFGAQQQVTIPTTTGIRFSINVWAARVVGTGSPTIASLTVTAIWRSGTTTLRTDTLGTVPLGGGALSAKSIAPPATADNVIVRVHAAVSSWASGNVIRLYADALAVTAP